MGGRVIRGEIRLAPVGGKTRPVLVLTRTEVIDVRSFVTVAGVTTSTRGLATEVDLNHRTAGLDRASVINCDGLYTVAKASLSTPIGSVDQLTLDRVCRAVAYALGC
ncbi:MAG: type II toxin-antitoxin system PemK/MazF family toxin [Acidimicrobiia bacterium]|nr:type II toxin-antitoxin system PemK/MazF family toxin [Acidimicrobiia bacterium]